MERGNLAADRVRNNVSDFVETRYLDMTEVTVAGHKEIGEKDRVFPLL
jgi:hypothetical protein